MAPLGGAVDATSILLQAELLNGRTFYMILGGLSEGPINRTSANLHGSLRFVDLP